MPKQYDVAVLGATGTVGQAIIEILESRSFPVRNLYPLASSNSAGDMITFRGEEIKVLDAEQFDFAQAQIGFFSAGGSVSKIYVPKAVEAGCIVIDNTAEYRYEPDVPLVIPEVNPHAIAQYKKRGIIANPNCSTIQMLVALKPIYDAVGISRINVATYQAVSGTGKKAIEELAQQTMGIFNQTPHDPEVYPKQIAFNVLPQIDVLLENGYTKEEMKMVWETQKILEDDSVLVNATAVRVPVFFGHSEALHIETRKKITADEARDLLENAPGVVVYEDRDPGGYPTPFTEAADNDPVFVGRIREDISHPMGLDLWVVADNVRKGAALNSVQIAENLIETYMD